MKPLLLALCALAMALPALAADPTPTPTPTPASTPKPKLKLAADKFPAGHETPEGVACDLARAFIQHDPALFMSTCLPTASGAGAKPEYRDFEKNIVLSMKTDDAKTAPAPEGPKAIAKVFAARHLSKNGPASYAYATFDYQDVMFVDVSATLHNGSTSLVRALVIQAKDGKWFVHPAPTISPLLCDGLDDESPSTQDFSEAYDLTP